MHARSTVDRLRSIRHGACIPYLSIALQKKVLLIKKRQRKANVRKSKGLLICYKYVIKLEYSKIEKISACVLSNQKKMYTKFNVDLFVGEITLYAIITCNIYIIKIEIISETLSL